MVWATARPSFDVEWEDLVNCTLYDLEEDGIQVLHKHVQCFKTESPGYLLFVNNQSDPLDLSSQIEEDIGTTWVWNLWNKAPWENNYGAKKTNANDKQSYYKKAPNIEYKQGHGEDIMNALRKWIKSRAVAKHFGNHLKLVECLTSRSPPRQVDDTVRMNGHGQRFQTSVGMVELLGLNDPNGKVTVVRNPTTVRAMILAHSHIDNNPVFLSITKNGTLLHGKTHTSCNKLALLDNLHNVQLPILDPQQQQKSKQMSYINISPRMQ